MAILRRKMSNKRRRVKISNEELFSRIKEKAYDLYQNRGYSHGDDWADWFEAERQVRTELRSR